MGSGSSTEIGDFQEKQLPAFAPPGQAPLAGRLGSVIPLTYAHSLPSITNPFSLPFVGFCGPAAASITPFLRWEQMTSASGDGHEMPEQARCGPVHPSKPEV